MSKDLLELSEKAAEKILSYPESSTIRVVSHYDADGITAAAIISKALRRKGYNFHISLMRNPFTEGLKRLKKEDNDLIIFTDMGSGQIEQIENIDTESIIIDHHQAIKEKTKSHILQINSNLCDINGNYEACGATLVFSVAKSIDNENIDLSPLALTGATGDKQYIGGIRGYNKQVLTEALEEKTLQEKTEPKLSGENIFDSLYYSIDPYYPELSGNKEQIEKILKKLNIKPDSKVDELTEKQKKQLNSYLLLVLIENDVEKNILDTVIRKRYYSIEKGYELESYADLLDSCGKGGKRGLALATALGDQEAYKKAAKLEKKYKQKILKELMRLDEEGAKEKKTFRYFYCKESSQGGVVGGIAVNFIFDKQKPLLSISRKNDEIHVSCRGTQHLVSKGLDLGEAMKQTAEKLNGNGGGHKIAAGATIDSDKEKQFLEQVNIIISNQLQV